MSEFEARRFYDVSMSKTGSVNIGDAKKRFARLIRRVEAGDEVVIAHAGRPVARLVPYRLKRGKRKAGTLRGKIVMGPDFDAPLPPEIQRYFDGEDDEPL